MSRTFHNNDDHIRVRGVRKDPPDLRRLARALIALAEAQAETEAEAEARAGIQAKAEIRAKRSRANRTIKPVKDQDNTSNQGDAA
ncbi:hypothetical protein [Acidithrix sp. C25]|uniref:hypothetical protein n=1 Tax=Acidithrix sp. C25 TaxID=1671482 RepID=UPI00191B8F86|nr:hypothetical protein [Acidithrix sp. C25]CAG4927276.1 unnamed protein product [Acidithrix sp. C25]